MAGYKTCLEVGSIYNTNSEGTPFYPDSIEIEGCNYAFDRLIDDKGEPQSDVIGGCVAVSYAGIPPAKIHQWLIGKNEYRNVRIVVKDLEDNTIPDELLRLDNVACISFRMNYERVGNGYVSSIFVLQAEDVMLSGQTVNNNWAK